MKIFLILLVLPTLCFSNVRELTFFPRANDFIVFASYQKTTYQTQLNASGSQKFKNKVWSAGFIYGITDKLNFLLNQPYSELEQDIKLDSYDVHSKSSGRNDPSASISYRFIKQSLNSPFSLDISLSYSPKSDKALKAEPTVNKEGNTKRGSEIYFLNLKASRKRNDKEYLLGIEIEHSNEGESFSSYSKKRTEIVEAYTSSTLTYGVQKNFDDTFSINFTGFISHSPGLKSKNLNDSITEFENNRVNHGLVTTLKYSFTSTMLMEFELLSLNKFSDILIDKSDGSSLEISDLRIKQMGLRFIYQI